MVLCCLKPCKIVATSFIEIILGQISQSLTQTSVTTTHLIFHPMTQVFNTLKNTDWNRLNERHKLIVWHKSRDPTIGSCYKHYQFPLFPLTRTSIPPHYNTELHYGTYFHWSSHISSVQTGISFLQPCYTLGS